MVTVPGDSERRPGRQLNPATAARLSFTLGAGPLPLRLSSTMSSAAEHHRAAVSAAGPSTGEGTAAEL